MSQIGGGLEADVPLRFRHLLKRCLQKNAQRRLRDIGDARIELEELLLPGSGEEDRAVSTDGVLVRRAQWRSGLMGAGVATLLTASVASVFLVGRTRPATEKAVDTGRAILTRLTNYGGTETAGAISPDGRYFAFVSSRTGQSDVYVRQVSSGEPIQITNDEAREADLVYAPDGETIYFSSVGAETAIWRVPALGGPPRKVVDGARAPEPCSDGERLAYVRGTQATSVVEVSTVDGSDPRVVHEGPSIESVAWSRDCRWLATAEGLLFEARNIHLIDAETGDARQLTYFTEGTILSQAFLPYGRHLLISRGFDPFPRARTTDLALVPIDGGPVERLSLSLDSRFIAPRISRNGERLVVTMERLRHEIWRVPLVS